MPTEVPLEMTHAPGHDDAASGHDAAIAPEAPESHTEDPGHGDHGDEALGPIDVAAWAAGAFGVAVGLVIVACFVLATAPA